MEVHHHGIDIIRGSAVVIHHADLGNRFQQGPELHLIRPVGIHHNQNAVIVAHQQGILAGNEHIPVFRKMHEFFQQTSRGIVLQVDDDAGFFPLFAAQAVDAHGRAHGIQIRVFMTHDEHMITLGNELHKRVGGNTGTHLAAVIGFLAAAAVKIEIEPILDNGLIAAPAQSHFDAQSRETVALFKIRAVYAHAHGNRGRQSGGADNPVNILQQGELVGFGSFQIPALKNEQKTVPLQPPQKPFIVLRPAGNGIVQPGVQVGNGAFRQVLGHFFVIINEDDGNYRAGADVFVPHLVELCQVTEIQHTQPVSGGAQQSAVQPVPAASKGNILGRFVLSGCQKNQRNTRDQIGNLLIHRILQGTAELRKAVVFPDNAAVFHADHHRRKGTVSFGNALQRVRFGLNILPQHSAAVLPVHQIIAKG